ncbi:glycoside hydrolase family 3 C-terminal domain-containing protein [Microbacterium sp. VKM Ac-2870]|uniref:beta-xylosidase/alpha-l-arabinosidase n=1 Tax=Microbacterium sp. VKM Ac-2870 TaxID=2783825 RepID=UPI001889EDFA|nr:glycoside hydrolase family 3 N-terminal domain-containing protein [Microbacterium sp. VKM Ac-2870]MBF4561319.1 glycoside hydrolase family 3 C-terminal domain-containing protein [Microbacterium sp. VKM Ac-2870]
MTISDNTSLDNRLVPPPSPRVAALIEAMTLEQKVAQLVGFWVDQGDEVVAPMAGEMASSDRYEQISAHGLGHLTRVYGTRPVDAAERASWLWNEQQRLRAASGHGIAAIVHEESLTGLAAWRAATFPTPLAWGAAFDPDLVHRMGRLIGDSMRELGVHQTLAPVLDVIRDPRWGRVDECIAEDPYVVATIATAYVRGIQDAGVHATLKHFVGYSASQAGRNHAPVHAGPRELADVFLPPFEMAVRDGGARSVMNSYTDIDGIPVASDPTLLTDLLRGQWGFDGVVVSDYFAIAFLETMHAVAADRTEAARLALTAGIDVELPSGDAYAAPLLEGLRDGRIDEALVDRALARVLAQKEDLGLLDPDHSAAPTEIDLDSPAHRTVARELAERSLVLLANDGTLPLGPEGRPGRIAVIGPNGHDASALMGCYSFANHVLAHHPGTPFGFEIPTVAEALREELPAASVVSVAGCDVEGDDRSGFAGAVDAAASADVAIVVVGDRAGLFGRGTVGEGNDTESLELPGVQRELVEQVVATGTPVVLVVVTGRPYALSWALDGDAGSVPAAVVQAFFPGEEGGTAIARVLSGAVAPSGRLPVSLPRSAGAQPFSYLHPILGGDSDVTSADSTPVRPFGFGLGYTTFARTDLSAPAEARAAGTFEVAVTVTNTGHRAGTDVVQLYAHDVHASVVRPVAQLLGYARVSLEPGASARVRFDVPSARLAFTGREGARIVEPGRIDLWVGASVAERETTATITLTGTAHRVTPADSRIVGVHVE